MASEITVDKGDDVMPDDSRIDKLEGRMDIVEERLDGHDRSYDELRKQTEKLNEKQIRLDARMEEGFKRSEDQNNQILSAIDKLYQRQDTAEEQNQQRHQQMIKMITQGDRQNSQEAAAGDRRNYEAISQRRWDAKSIWITVLITAAIGIPAVISAWKAFG